MAPASGVSLLGEDGRGKKRPAADELEGEQPLAKKFGLLHIAQQHPPPIATNHAAAKHTQTPTPTPSPHASISPANDGMQIDETAHRVYIHDLDSEIAETEAQENNIAFLPEIEKRLMSVPKSVLANKPHANNALVLYRVPSSLSVPEPEDNVRRAIEEARERARAKAIAREKEKEKKEAEMQTERTHEDGDYDVRNGSFLSSSMRHTTPLSPDFAPSSPYDSDAMDIDGS
ncbi:hypothetical protein AJ79_03847 [Helicocarpus griseus UAMH5409]|uniref:Uncharacterized protein n=1 Tax=Helicocarpus griseus UAMH5409 TaxID=1447875 RepID=A0A2B7XVV6_9EURO|nr:hypothetical protein AJ79_03847 [Helicocarpus griseus UAMH5409]